MNTGEKILTLARQKGFDLGGIASVQSLGFWADNYEKWLGRGFHADMSYMENHLDQRRDLRARFPWARSVIALGISYYSPEAEPGDWHISRYARGADYHIVLEEKIKSLVESLRAEDWGKDIQARFYVDTGPIPERSYAALAGLGWVGKNGNLISQQIGSWFFLGEILTDLSLESSAPAVSRCGSCTRCIEACPTRAILEPGIIDSRLCIPYLNIEKRGELSPEESGMLGAEVFGCDICQDICPWNKFAKATSEENLKPRPELEALTLETLILLGREDYERIFRKSAVKRAKREGLRRNAIIVATNLKAVDCIPAIRRCLEDENPLLQNTAKWALAEFEGQK